MDSIFTFAGYVNKKEKERLKNHFCHMHDYW